MIRCNEGKIAINGDVAELCADLFAIVGGLTEVLKEDWKDETEKLIIFSCVSGMLGREEGQRFYELCEKYNVDIRKTYDILCSSIEKSAKKKKND